MVTALILALPESSGSGLYGVFDFLSLTAQIHEYDGSRPSPISIVPQIVSVVKVPFRCRNGIPVIPSLSIDDVSGADIVIIPDLWMPPPVSFQSKYPQILDWLRMLHAQGIQLCSFCSGAVLLAEAGLLDGKRATSHWLYEDLFRQQFPQVAFCTAGTFIAADSSEEIITASGGTAWHDLANHLINRYCGNSVAIRVSRFLLLKQHAEGQRPYQDLTYKLPHADKQVKLCEEILAKHYRQPSCLKRAVAASGIPERTLKRRFRAATGSTLIEYIQKHRVEGAKTLLAQSNRSISDICIEVGYQEPAAFRRIFHRFVGLSPNEFRRMFNGRPSVPFI